MNPYYFTNKLVEINDQIQNGKYTSFIPIQNEIASLRSKLYDKQFDESKECHAIKTKLLQLFKGHPVENKNIFLMDTLCKTLDKTYFEQNDDIIRYFIMTLEHKNKFNINLILTNNKTVFDNIAENHIGIFMILLYTSDIDLSRINVAKYIVDYHWLVHIIPHIFIATTYYNIQSTRLNALIKAICTFTSSDTFYVIPLLFKYSWDINYVDSKGNNLMYFAILYSNYPMVLFLEANKFDFQTKTKDQYCYIKLMIQNEHLMPNIDVIRKLIKHGSEINITHNKITLLSMMCNYYPDELETIKLLLDNGASVNLMDHYYHSPLLFAILNSPKLCKLLMQYKTSINTSVIFVLIGKISHYIYMKQDYDCLGAETEIFSKYRRRMDNYNYYEMVLYMLGYVIDTYYNDHKSKYNLVKSCIDDRKMRKDIMRRFNDFDDTCYGIHTRVYAKKNFVLRPIIVDNKMIGKLLIFIMCLYKNKKNYGMVFVLKHIVMFHIDLFV